MSRFKRVIVVEDFDGEITEELVKKSSYQELKMIISFVEKEKDLRWIQEWTTNELIQVDIDNLINKCF